MAGADILLSAEIIRLRLDREQYEDVPIEANTGAPRINMLQDDPGDRRAYEHQHVLTQFLEEQGIDPEKWDKYVAGHEDGEDKTAPEDSAFQDLSSIESLPYLSEEIEDTVGDDEPEEAEPFDPAWIGILQKDQLADLPPDDTQKILKLPMPSSFLLEDSTAGSETASEDLEESYRAAEDSDLCEEDSDDELLFKWAMQDDSGDDQPQTWDPGDTRQVVVVNTFLRVPDDDSQRITYEEGERAQVPL